MNALENALQPLASIKLSRLPRATRLALEIFDRLDGGALAIELPDGTHLRAGHGPLVAHLRVRDHAVFDETLARGDIGFGESWMDGLWDTEDLTGLLTLLSRNRARIGEAIYGRMFRMLGHRIAHLLRANTRAGSRRNIEAHYDLGNDFYALWLDPSMTYSAAVFDSPTESLHDAQLRKYRRILGELGVQPGQTLLEVGCGWGGFAEVAATEFGCRVLCITLSPSQLAYARARAERGGFADRVDFALCDYRDVRGQYDHVVSIEMIEAVGERFWPTYFAQLSARLKPGRALRGAGDHDRGCPVWALPARNRLHPASRVPRRHAAQPGGGGAPGAGCRARGGGRFRLRPGLRPHAGALACPLRGAVAGDQGAGLRRAFPPHVAFLPGLLRGRLRDR